jgi:predicted peroxiredoxin
MDGTIWAMKKAADGVQVDGFEPLTNYLETFLSMGGKLLVCAPCTEYYCNVQSDGGPKALIEGAELAGLATVVAAAGQNCSVVTF